MLVIGAGAAGITAAYFLAQAGVDVVLLERGPYPGSKNMSGGAVYSLPTREFLPDFWQEAPVERALRDHQFWLMTETSAIKLGFTSVDFVNPPYNRFSVMRATFDRWYAGKAVQAGACLWTECKAESLLLDGKKVIGAHISGNRSGHIHADIVILAQGANPILAEKAGLIKKPKAANYSLYVKEMLYLPREVISERFQLKDNEGTVIGLLGDNTAGLVGTGSLYTFKEHIGLNTGVGVKTLADKKVNISDLMARLKRHSVIEPLIRGGTTVEYLAHLIPEGGYNAVPRLVFDGMMITGDAAGLVNGTHGLNLAMYSGKFAADTAIKALEECKFTGEALNHYRERLEGSFVLKDMWDNRKIPGWFAKNPTLFDDYITLFNQAAFQVTMVHPVSRREKRRVIRKAILAARPAGKLLVDALQGIRVVK
ncbi:MAG: FAD-dependent oxidoreductase [Eubacteriales bacterium]